MPDDVDEQVEVVDRHLAVDDDFVLEMHASASRARLDGGCSGRRSRAAARAGSAGRREPVLQQRMIDVLATRSRLRPPRRARCRAVARCLATTSPLRIARRRRPACWPRLDAGRGLQIRRARQNLARLGVREQRLLRRAARCSPRARSLRRCTRSSIADERVAQLEAVLKSIGRDPSPGIGR